jgi:molecular chaperone GrpE
MIAGKKPPPASPFDSAQGQPQHPASPEGLAKLRAEADALKGELERLKDIAGRAQADLQNAKDRLERERQEISKFALEGALRRLLPTIDNFQRAFQHLPEELKAHEWVKGIVALEQDFVKTVMSFGLARMESLGQQVDPRKHEVLMTGSGEAGKVVEVFEEGYTFNGRVLRVAKVKVGSGAGTDHFSLEKK